MMVRDLLLELAEEAPNYADADRVVRGSRRRRRLAVVTGPAAAAVALVIVIVAVWWPTGAGHHDVRPGRNPRLSDYPVVAPGPADDPVSQDSATALVMVYAARYQGYPPPLVGVTAGGGRYRLDWLPERARLESMSPNGRWLVFEENNGMTRLYDMAGHRVRSFPDAALPDDLDRKVQTIGWSPESRYLWLWCGSDGYRRVDPASGRTVSYRPPDGTAVIAVLPGGDALVASVGRYAPQLTLPTTLRRVDPVTRTERAIIQIATDQDPDQDQEVVYNNFMSLALINPAGTRLALIVGDESGPSALLDVELPTGQVLHRLLLPQIPVGSDVSDLDPERNALVGTAAYLAEGVLLATVGSRDGDEPALDLLDTDSGQVRRLTRVPDASTLLVRGGDRDFSGTSLPSAGRAD